MEIIKQVRELEAHIKSIAATKEEQIKIISKAQGIAVDFEQNLLVLAIVKNRIMHAGGLS
jgi:F0F1-type ATP synthase delta subunit